MALDVSAADLWHLVADAAPGFVAARLEAIAEAIAPTSVAEGIRITGEDVEALVERTGANVRPRNPGAIHLVGVLHACKGDFDAAAVRLGVSVATLQHWCADLRGVPGMGTRNGRYWAALKGLR